MSTWTHVAVTIRFDALRIGGMDERSRPELGNTCGYGDDPDVWEACDVPCGSEGSLQYQVWENPDKSHLAAYTAMIWGDLRDYSSIDDIVLYLTRITHGKMIRQGIAEIAVEGQPPCVARYSDETGTWMALPVFMDGE